MRKPYPINSGICKVKWIKLQVCLLLIFFNSTLGISASKDQKFANQFSDSLTIVKWSERIMDLKNHDLDSAHFLADSLMRLGENRKWNWALSVAYNRKGILYLIQNKGNDAKLFLEKSIAYSQKSGAERIYSSSLKNLGNYHFVTGNYESALKYYFMSQDINERLNDTLEISSIYSNLAMCFEKIKMNDKAIEFNERSLALREKLNNEKELAQSLANLGGNYIQAGNFTKAKLYYNQALPIQQKHRNLLGVANSFYNLSVIHTADSNYTEAQILVDSSLMLYSHLGNIRGQILCKILQAKLLHIRGDFEEGIRLNNKAIVLSTEISSNYEKQMLISICINFINQKVNTN